MLYKISGIELQGSSHLSKNIPCQDKTAHIMFDNCACIALADGAGSRRFSHFGAEIATKALCEYFKNNSELTEYEPLKILNEVKSNLINSEYCFDDLASTLLFVFVNENMAVIGHLGDGMIFGVSDNDVQVLSYPENGDQKNTTFFTTDVYASKHLRIKKIDLSEYSEYVFVLTSDGGESLLFNNSSNTPAKAVTTFASWIKDGETQEINMALYNNLNGIVPKFTSDDFSLIEMYVKISK